MIKITDILNLKNSYCHNISKVRNKFFENCSIDSRNIGAGDFFLAVKGENTDGHNYLKDVFKKKIQLAVVNDGWFKKEKDKYINKSFIVVKNTVKSLGELALAHRKNFRVIVFGIAGSNGKTTTKDLIADVLSQDYNVLKTEGNYNNHLGLPLTLLKLKSDIDICVVELGSNHFNELDYLCKIAQPDIGLITNIGKEHLEFFKNLDGVAKEEFTLFDYLSEKENTSLLMNVDDSYIRKYKHKKINLNPFTYSYKYKSDVKGKFLGFNSSLYPEINITFNKTNFNVRISSVGFHTIYNGLASAAAGLFFGISPQKIKKALSGYRSDSRMRMEIVTKKRIIIINDAYNSNPDSVKIGLETLKKYNIKGNKHIVLADMLELGKQSRKEHLETGSLVRNMNFENLYTYGEKAKYIFKGAKGVKNNFYFEEKKDLIDFLKCILKPDDMLYVKGSRGMKMEEVIEQI